MTGALRRASGLALAQLRRSGGVGSSSSGRAAVQQLGQQQQQQAVRHNHDLGVHNNKFIERWLSRREDIEGEFRWTPATVRHVAIFAVAIPIAIYNGVVWAAHQHDEYGGRPKRDFLWGHAEAGERAGAAKSA